MKKRIFGICLLMLSLVALLTFVSCGECEHSYDHVCDTVCNKCEAERTVAGHTYDNDCDARCNKCNEKREVADHSYAAVCDTKCAICGATRDAEAHTYANDCDTQCDLCGAERQVGEHIYSNDCDNSCNSCGVERTVGDHVYGYVCDTVCDECGTVREAEKDHTYSGDCDEYCNVCEWQRESATEHTYTADCDPTCEICYENRTAPVQHALSEWTSDRNATCEQDGTKSRSCPQCTAIETVTDAGTAKGHQYPAGDGYTYNNDATHLKDGTESKRCLTCQKSAGSRTATGTAGHTFDTNGKCTGCGWHAPDLSAYMVYESFEEYQYKNSAFTVSSDGDFSVGNVKTYAKIGVTYTAVVRGSGLAEQNLRALKIARSTSKTTSGNEADVDIIPSGVLTSKHVITFDIKISDTHGADIIICGAKTVGGNTTFNELVRYDAKNEQVIVCGIAVEKGGVTGSWHSIAIEIDDANRTFAIYIEGELIAGNLPYTDTSYPTSSSAVSFYRITASEGPSAVEFYLDNITVYNGAYRAN